MPFFIPSPLLSFTLVHSLLGGCCVSYAFHMRFFCKKINMRMRHLVPSHTHVMKSFIVVVLLFLSVSFHWLHKFVWTVRESRANHNGEMARGKTKCARKSNDPMTELKMILVIDACLMQSIAMYSTFVQCISLEIASEICIADKRRCQ